MDATSTVPSLSTNASRPRAGQALAHLQAAMQGVSPLVESGRIVEVLGTLVKAVGIDAVVGDLCELRRADGSTVGAEVIGFSGAAAILVPFGDIVGLSTRTDVVATRRTYAVPAGCAGLGRVLDGFGRPIDGRGAIASTLRASVDAMPPDALTRRPVDRVFATGIRAIDALLTVGRGQRVGLFAPVGAGKTTLIGQLAKRSEADVVVIGLIGERGREVGEFVEHVLGRAGLARSVVYVATSDRPAVERAKCAQVATTVAEAFRREGANVLLLMDSITRYARALRDIGLASGEVPTRRGFPPSVFAALPRLVERAGNDARGSITAFYTLLVEGDDEIGDPIAEEVRSLLDGHIDLSRALAQAHRFPAIDVLASLSRVMPALVSTSHAAAAATIRRWMASHRDVELLVRMGEYQRGADPDADEAIAAIPAIRRFLAQARDEHSTFDATWDALDALVRAPHRG